MAGTGWACSGSSCSRSDSLTAAASYPSITVTMNVAANASSPQVNQASVSGGGSLGTVIASDTATVAPSATVAQVGFVRADTTTQGNWQSTYGGDGYSIANVGSFVIPPYASLFLENQINYTWISGISDPRALVSDTAGDRIASAWYNPTSFSFDISTDGNPHQIALYFLDWDSQGRAETVQVVDANSGAPLDTRNIPGSNTSTTGANFVGGTYMVWVISGHVTITITANSGPNAVVSGIFFGGPTQTAPAITSASSTTFNVGKPATFAVTSTGYPTSALSETGALPGGVTFVDNGNGTGTLSGTPAANSASSYSIVFTANNGVSPNATENFTLTVNQPVSSGPSATFVSPDTVTQGNWMGVYGADGYDVANGPQSPAGGTLSYGSYSVQNQSNWTWAASTSDQRALQTDSQGDRIAATWYNPTVFNFDVNLTGTHQVALYVLDWDSQGRGETIQITDANNPGSLLDRRSIPATGMTSANFVNGTYLVWNISGHVTITVTTNSGPNAVVAGIFFGGAGTVTQPAQATASWVKSNTATEGTWMGVYGSQGYSLATAGSNFQSISIPATFSVQGQSNWAWASPTTDTRALETDTQGDRAAATWYSPSSFSFALNLTDGQTHQVAIYVIDWDSKGRAETISIADANSGKVLDARSIPNANAGSATYTNTTSANFFGGTYLIWNVSGSVTITITSNSGPNAVASGVFLDQ
jgi:predicted Fe-Mo cluster-binding NifX family protein